MLSRRRSARRLFGAQSEFLECSGEVLSPRDLLFSRQDDLFTDSCSFFIRERYLAVEFLRSGQPQMEDIRQSCDSGSAHKKQQEQETTIHNSPRPPVAGTLSGETFLYDSPPPL